MIYMKSKRSILMYNEMKDFERKRLFDKYD